MSALIESVRRESATVLEWFRALGHELGEMRLSGPRGRQCTLTALSTALSVAIALALRMDYVWWAGISGFMSMQASGSGSIRRVSLRIAGTVAGAAFALVATPWLADDHVAGSLFVFAIAALGILGSMVSRYSYAWLFAGMTANLIILSSLQDPVSAFHFAVYRTMEVTIGSGVAMVLAFAFAPEGPTPPEAARHGWSHLLGRDWHAVMHAMRSGLAVMLLPWVWGWLDLPSLPQMSITVAAVMAVPMLSDNPLDDGRWVLVHALHRLLGCVLGGLAGLALLALSMTQFLPWLASLTVGVWICCHLQTSQRGIGYIGTQAAMVLIITLVQAWGPPSSIMPGIDRLAGMIGGLCILTVVSLIFWPDKLADRQEVRP